MPAVEESLRNVVGRQQLAFGKIPSETSSIKAMLERVIQTQEEQAIQEFTVTTTVSPRTGATIIVTSSTPTIRQSPSACNLPPREHTDNRHTLSSLISKPPSARPAALRCGFTDDIRVVDLPEGEMARII